ncbi:MAG: DNA-binding protein, partial [Eubacteriales bacterium]|nr:DNA-binding protein [Eubacteriales bacterium]
FFHTAVFSRMRQRLKLVSHYRKVKRMVSEIQQCANELERCEDKEEIRKKVSKIAEISAGILEEY